MCAPTGASETKAFIHANLVAVTPSRHFRSYRPAYGYTAAYCSAGHGTAGGKPQICSVLILDSIALNHGDARALPLPLLNVATLRVLSAYRGFTIAHVAFFSYQMLSAVVAL
jgi:hypothetical protein